MDAFLVVKLLLLVVALVALFLAYVFLGGLLTGAGYQPTPRSAMEKMFELSEPDQKKVFDLGSGFGRIVIEVAQRFHADCIGVEVDPMKVWWSRRAIRKLGIQDRAKIVKGNLMSADISSADIVYVFLWKRIMQRFREKALKEMKPGSMVVSYYYRFEGWQPEQEDSRLKVYVYRITARAPIPTKPTPPLTPTLSPDSNQSHIQSSPSPRPAEPSARVSRQHSLRPATIENIHANSNFMRFTCNRT